jgi:vacuolar-type H+-ATPase subunit C/Vma6
MSDCTVRLDGNPTGSDYTRIEDDVENVSILLKSKLENYNGIIRFNIQEDGIHIYVHSVKDGFEQKPLAYMLGYNSLIFNLKES